jgi:Arc/MetJ-type ribon-helix-helix transcriptional regulator
VNIHLPDDLANSIRAEVLSGHFSSEDEMVAAVLRDYLHRKCPQAPTEARPRPPAAGQELGPDELQRHLFDAGIISEIKPPGNDRVSGAHLRAKRSSKRDPP